MHPGFPAKKGTLEKVYGISFDIKTEADNGNVSPSGQILFGGKKFSFSVPVNEQLHENQAVIFNNPKLKPESAAGFQIVVRAKAEKLRCYVKNIIFLDKNGQPL